MNKSLPITDVEVDELEPFFCAEFEKELTSIVILPILSDISLAVPVLLDRIYKIFEYYNLYGSDTSTTYPFLREIMPEYAVISVGKDNSYGHPTDNNLSRLRDADVTVYQTDLNGDVYVTSDGQSVTISSDKSAGYDEIMTPGGKASTAQSSGTSQNTQGSTSAPSGTDYVVNINTGKFHYPSCGSVNKMKESNKLYYTGTRDDLISQGYDPCGNCHP